MVANNEEAAPLALERPGETVEQRVQRLEDAVAALQDTRQIENRLLERLTEQLRPAPAPLAEPAPPPPPVAERIVATPAPEPPPMTHADLTAKFIQAAPTMIRQAWLLADIYNEVRAMVRMFCDVRYSVGWPARLTVLIVVPLILISAWLMPFTTVPFLGSIMMIVDKLIDLILAFVVYKVLSREAQRYMQVQAARYGGS